MFDVMVRQSLDLEEFVEETYDVLSCCVVDEIENFLKAKFGEKSPILNAFYQEEPTEYLDDFFCFLMRKASNDKDKYVRDKLGL